MRKAKRPAGLLSQLEAALTEAQKESAVAEQAYRAYPQQAGEAWEAGYYQGRKHALELATATIRRVVLS
jgi:hypothetical protein